MSGTTVRFAQQRTRKAALALVAIFALCVSACSAGTPGEETSATDGGPVVRQPRPTGSLTERTTQFELPKSDSDRPYLSGVWLGGTFTPEALESFGDYRGSPVETVTTYTSTDTWETMENDWTISVFDQFPGTLVYGMALLPDDDGTLTEVADGDHDETWRAVAANLVKNGRERSIVRIGFEANGTWFRWGATEETASEYKAAFRRAATIVKDAVPEAVIGFDVGCGVALSGSDDRMAPLTQLYPGDDVVDVIGCDVYDNTHALHDESGGPGHTNRGPGLEDVRQFAVAHGKLMTIPEWGLDHTYGYGDNPAFIVTVAGFLKDHGSDILFENYFSEPGTALRSSIWNEVQNPSGAETYVSLW